MTATPEPEVVPAPEKRLHIKTYGCQMNVYDSERMADVLRPLGYGLVDGRGEGLFRDRPTEGAAQRRPGLGRHAHRRGWLRRPGRGGGDDAPRLGGGPG